MRDSVIVKPKVERLQLAHGVKPEDIKDFVGPREFLTKFNGVKQKMHEAALATKRAEEREKRTFSKYISYLIIAQLKRVLQLSRCQVHKT